jgi:hypothetical protein
VKAMFSRFIRDTNILGQLTKLHQTSIVEDYIDGFECWVVQIENLTNEYFKQCFINGLKEEFIAQVEMNHPATWAMLSPNSPNLIHLYT